MEKTKKHKNKPQLQPSDIVRLHTATINRERVAAEAQREGRKGIMLNRNNPAHREGVKSKKAGARFRAND